MKRKWNESQLNNAVKSSKSYRQVLHKLGLKEAGGNYQQIKKYIKEYSAGIKQQKCEECGWARKNSEGYLPLELDHINGDHMDNRLENLRVLCPNCHSLKPNHRGRNIGKNNK